MKPSASKDELSEELTSLLEMISPDLLSRYQGC